MREDRWTNSKTNTELGVTGPLGSPRAWLRRAFDAASLDDIAFQPGALTPHEISVGAVWYKPCTLPVTNDYRTLYRYFDIPAVTEIHKNIKQEPLLPAIGVAMAVPVDQIVAWIKLARESGAAYTWWKTPENKSLRVADVRPKKNQLDHAKIYELLDQGMTRREIAQLLNYPPNNVDYVVKKWTNGIPLSRQQPWANKMEMVQDFLAGTPVSVLAEQYKKSPAYIHKVVKAHR